MLICSLYKVFDDIFIHIFRVYFIRLFFLLYCKSCLYMLDKNPLLNICFTNIFLIHGLPYFLQSVIQRTEVFKLMKSSLFIFLNLQSVLLKSYLGNLKKAKVTKIFSYFLELKYSFSAINLPSFILEASHDFYILCFHFHSGQIFLNSLLISS